MAPVFTWRLFGDRAIKRSTSVNRRVLRNGTETTVVYCHDGDRTRATGTLKSQERQTREETAAGMGSWCFKIDLVDRYSVPSFFYSPCPPVWIFSFEVGTLFQSGSWQMGVEKLTSKSRITAIYVSKIIPSTWVTTINCG